MAFRNNRKCIACGEKYSYCPNCSGSDRFAPSWKAEFCSESCKDLWLTATKFNMDLLSKADAKSIISALDLKPIDVYAACVQRDYAKIMAEEKKPRKIKKIEPIVEIAPIVEQLEEVAEPVVAEPIHEVILKENE
jgi:hypothetical protein